MKFFSKRKDRPLSLGGEKAADWIANGISRLQSRWAKQMDRWVNGWSQKRKAVAFSIVCLSLFGYSTILIAGSFNLAISEISIPKQIDAPLRINPVMGSPQATGIYKQQFIEKLRKRIDGLQDGNFRDSLMKAHPKLLDSLRQLEKIYCEQ